MHRFAGVSISPRAAMKIYVPPCSSQTIEKSIEEKQPAKTSYHREIRLIASHRDGNADTVFSLSLSPSLLSRAYIMKLYIPPLPFDYLEYQRTRFCTLITDLPFSAPISIYLSPSITRISRHFPLFARRNSSSQIHSSPLRQPPPSRPIPDTLFLYSIITLCDFVARKKKKINEEKRKGKKKRNGGNEMEARRGNVETQTRYRLLPFVCKSLYHLSIFLEICPRFPSEKRRSSRRGETKKRTGSGRVLFS